MKWNWIAWLGVLALSLSTLTAQADYILRIVHFPNLTQGAEPFDFAKLSQDPAITKIFYPELTLIPGRETSIKDGRTIQVPTEFDKDGKVLATESEFCGQQVRATLTQGADPRTFEINFTISSVIPTGFTEFAAANGNKIHQATFWRQKLESKTFLREGMRLPMPLSAGPDNGFYSIQLLKK